VESTFGVLSTAVSALYAQKRGLDITGQNIANVNTDGYSRQRLSLQAVGAAPVGAIYSVDNGSGGGVQVVDVGRIRDALLDSRSRAEHAQGAYRSGQQAAYTQIEQVFNEPSDTGLQSQLTGLWSAFSDLASHPGDLATRRLVIQQASVVTDGMAAAATNLTSVWSTAREQYAGTVAEINSTATAMAQLNQAIERAQGAGSPINELADLRDAKAARLAELTGATAVSQADGTVSLFLSGSALVMGANARQVRAAGSSTLPGQPVNPVSLQWTDTGQTATVAGGQLASDLRTLNSLVPDEVAGLDAVAAGLAAAVNTQHSAGYDLNGDGGLPLFSGATAATLRIAIGDPRQIAAASTTGTDPVTGAAVGTMDSGNAEALAAIGRRADGPGAAYRQLIADLGVNSQGAARLAAIQSGVTQQVDQAQAAQSGVNLDEEMTNLLQFQRAYEAAARVISTIDSVFDALINRMGVR
jgi:flagellar hook-associated protein 1